MMHLTANSIEEEGSVFRGAFIGLAIVAGLALAGYLGWRLHAPAESTLAPNGSTDALWERVWELERRMELLHPTTGLEPFKALAEKGKVR